MVFFSRKGETLPITNRAEDYAPGDLVTWDLHPRKRKARFPGTPDLGGGLTHIGMVVDRKTLLSRRYMIVHNIGQGPKLEDALFNWKITGHYRYFGSVALSNQQSALSQTGFTAKDAKPPQQAKTGLPPQHAKTARAGDPGLAGGPGGRQGRKEWERRRRQFNSESLVFPLPSMRHGGEESYAQMWIADC
jgi:hypothetical protein